MLVQNDWRGAELGSLARRQLGAQLFENSDRVQIDGPSVLLPAELATPFGLLIHELGTNAVKHGALSSDDGTIRLTWTLSPLTKGKLLEVCWLEQGGPQPDDEMKSGFGFILIGKGIPGAEVKREVRKAGLVYKIALPMDS
jgi:two-component system CheB/CheR fusion protein